MPAPRYVAVANPDGKRWQAYAAALTAFWSARGVVPDVVVVPWNEVVPRDGDLDGLSAFDRPALVRLDSPGRDWAVSRLLLQAGCRETGDGPAPFHDMPYDKGRLVRPGLLYAGFRRVLRGLRASFDRRPHLTPLACPLDVALMFDKNATSARLAAVGVPCPDSLPAPATVADLLAALRQERYQTAYVKLNTGSSASAIAVTRALEAEPWAWSSLARLPGGLYSTRRLRRYQGDDLAAVLAFLLDEGMCVQRGVRMAQIDGQNFDVRVVVVHGRPEHTIFRLSPLPMTNLHLGGRRGAWEACRRAVPTRAWLDALDHCAAAAERFCSASVGVDLLFEGGYLRHYVLEVNAFGDFFPGLTDQRGRGVHEVEIEATARRIGLV
jgi:hypothetical protein